MFLYCKLITMSCLDYLDYDVSTHLGTYVKSIRKRNTTYNKVMKQLQYMIDFNIHIQYLRKFTKFKKRYIPYHIGSHYEYLWDNKKLVEGTIEFLKQDKKTKYVHDWPTKNPIFADKSCYPTDKTLKKSLFTNGSQWKFHSYPPKRITLNHFPSMCKTLRDLK